MVQVLLAKRSDRPEAPEEAETLPGHLDLVLRVARTLLSCRGEKVLDMLGLDPDKWYQVLEWGVLCGSALHDLGKANEQFQELVRGRFLTQAYRHEVLSLVILHRRRELDTWLFNGVPPIARAMALRAVCGHHLRFDPNSSLAPKPSGYLKVTLLLDHPDFREALQRVGSLLHRGEPPVLKPVTLRLAEESAGGLKMWLLEAFGSDWDDDEVRRCAGAVMALLMASDICASAVVRREDDPAGWAGALLGQVLRSRDLEKIVQGHLAGRSLFPFQEEVASSPPRLTLVTAGCGTGKTVAAYCWAARQAEARRLFFCYPTTGTATEGFTEYAFPDFADGSALVHSRAAYDLAEIRASDDQPGAFEHAWSGLTPWGARLSVGTADAVLGLLQLSRTGLTAFPALAGAAFVFDEIHLYDDRLFGTLLRFLEAFRGAPVLLMTASLQPNRLVALQQLAQRLGQPLKLVPGPAEVERMPRYILVRSDFDTAVAKVQRALDSGQRVLWVANTVERAVAMGCAARERGWPVMIYHSRFRYRDRLSRHREVVDAFGKRSSRAPVLAVTTQVCEVSLDISADLLVTELAPPQSLIQRLGRLNRWALPAGEFPPATALILTPETEAPYNREELTAGQRWLDQLTDRPVSQQDLRHIFEQAAEGNTQLTAASVAWLDSMLDMTPRTLREPGATIEVLREEDLDRIKQRADAVGYAIPMLLGPVSDELSRWRRVFGIPVAPAGRIVYNETWGAYWDRGTGGG